MVGLELVYSVRPGPPLHSGRLPQGFAAVSWVEPSRSWRPAAMSAVGASCSFPCVPAIVSLLNSSPALRVGCANRSPCPFCDIRSTPVFRRRHRLLRIAVRAYDASKEKHRNDAMDIGAWLRGVGVE